MFENLLHPNSKERLRFLKEEKDTLLSEIFDIIPAEKLNTTLFVFSNSLIELNQTELGIVRSNFLKHRINNLTIGLTSTVKQDFINLIHRYILNGIAIRKLEEENEK